MISYGNFTVETLSFVPCLPFQEAGLSDPQTPVKPRHEMLTSTPALTKSNDQRSLSDVEKLLNETKKSLEQQETTYRNLIAEKKDSDKVLNEKIQTLENSLTDVRAQNIRLSSQLQYADEKEKILQVINHCLLLPLVCETELFVLAITHQ